MLHLNHEQVYHVFCLMIAMGVMDGDIDSTEAEMLTRLGFSLGLQPRDIEALSASAQDAIHDTSISDVLAFSMVRLKQLLVREQLEGVILILEYMARSDERLNSGESEVLKIARDVWLQSADSEV